MKEMCSCVNRFYDCDFYMCVYVGGGDAKLEKEFLAAAEARKMVQLAGHR